MSTTPTALAAADEPGGYVALKRTAQEIQGIVNDNLAGQDVNEFDLRRVGMPAGGATVWQVPALGGVQNLEELTGIVVFTKLTRSYWSNEQQTGDRPLCSSQDSLIGIGTPGGDCRSCPFAEYGSAINEKTGEPGPGQACTQRALWFMLRPDSFLPIVVSLSPASLKNAKQYMLDLSGAGLRYSEVVTKIGLEADRNATGDKFSRALPDLAAHLDPEERTKAAEYTEILRPLFEQAVAAIADEPAATA